MKDAQKPGHVSLNTLISHLKEGRFVIPDFQREFEWTPSYIRDLMRSIFLDYYIGSLLLWKGKDENFNSLSCESIYGFANMKDQLSWDKGGNRSEHIVLDGQQRLTAMYYAFVAPDVALPNRSRRTTYFIRVDKFMRQEYEEAFDYRWLTKSLSDVLDSRNIQYKQHLFPLAVLGSGRYDLPNWLQNYEIYWDKIASEAENSGDCKVAIEARRHAKNAELFGKDVTEIAEQYQISYVELDRDLEIDKVCDIFTKINSTGRQLSVFDLINALLKPKGLQLKHLWRKTSSRLDFVETDKMDVHVLQVMSLLLQSYCAPKHLYYLIPGHEKQIRTADGEFRKEVLIHDISTFNKQWDNAVAALESSINSLKHPQEFGAISAKHLPYTTILPVFAALQATCGDMAPERQLKAQRKINLWYWAAVFTNRYSGSVDSTASRDYLDVKAWMTNDEFEPALIREFNERFRGLELRKIMKGTSIYKGIFNLLVLQGSRDWITGKSPQHNDLGDHHIVPASWGKSHLEGSSMNTILNRTLLSADTNRNVINNRLPNEYLPELVKGSSEEQIREILDSHLISSDAQEILMRDPFEKSDYDEFLSERQRTLLNAIENLLIKDRLDLEPDIRELDSRIEKIELGLRKSIVDILENDSQQLPSHLLKKVDEAIFRASKKDPTVYSQEYEALAKKLEYTDLRELQEIITSRAKWPSFENKFTNKEKLNMRFDQLADLRNSIRHSRTVTDILRQDGQAALLWFEFVLKL